MRTIWIASYPKSGNTWLRMLIANLSSTNGIPVDINDLPERGGIASARGPLEYLSLLDTSLLTHDEIDELRPAIYEDLARGVLDDETDTVTDPPDVRFVKAHDAYTITASGRALLAGTHGANGAVVLVRDPRDVAPSLANHLNTTTDDAIAFMNAANGQFCAAPDRMFKQLRQRLPRWSGHVATWLDQTDIPVHLIRYEDMQADTIGVLRRALAFAGRSATECAIEQAVRFADFTTLREQERANGFREAPRSESGKGFFRRGVAGGWRDELTPDQVARIEAAHAPMMRRLGYALSTEPDEAPSAPSSSA